MIWVENLFLSLNGQEILQGIELHMQPGDIYGLLGPNGAGKSTTISALLGLRRRSGGKINVLGYDPRDRNLDIRRFVGVMPERAGFYGWMTAPLYLQWYARLYEHSPADKEIRELLEKVGLGEFRNYPIGSYSRGMKQRLAMARALVAQPKLLILDEPTNGLDPKGRHEIHDLLLGFAADQNSGVLLCTHLLNDVDRLCSRIGIIDQGRTRVEGSLSDLLAQKSAGQHYRLRLESMPELANLPDSASLLKSEGAWLHIHVQPGIPGGSSALWGELWQRGWRILEIRSEATGLEELYLDTIQAREAQ